VTAVPVAVRVIRSDDASVVMCGRKRLVMRERVADVAGD